MTTTLNYDMPSSITPAASHPREKLINTAANLVHHQGWTATGINQILSDAGIPKGSFYYYFRSKEALGLAILQKHFANTKQLLARTLLNTELSAEAASAAFFKETLAIQTESGFQFGCPIGSFANEIATQSPALLQEAHKGLTLMEEAWTTLVQRGQSEGTIPSSVSSLEFGKLAGMLFQGAMLNSKCVRNPQALEMVSQSIHKMLFLGLPYLKSATTVLSSVQALAS